MKKILVDYDLCEANGICQKAAPEVFQVDDEDELHLLMEEVDDALAQKVELAIERCPRQALAWSKD